MARLRRDELMVAKEMVAREVPVRQVARQLGVDESSLRYRLRRAVDAPDGRQERPSVLDGWETRIDAVLARWAERDSGERERPRTAQSFCVPKADIAAQGYDLSLNRYKEVVHEVIEHRPPKEILADLAKLEEEIQRGMKELEGMLG